MKRLVLASANAGKIREFAKLLAPLGVEIVSQAALGIESAPEPHITFIENALAKARHASQRSGLPALADDSGICVPALGGAPGVYSARYAEPQWQPARGDAEQMTQDQRNNAKLIEKLQGVQDRSAYYVAALVLVRHAEDPLPVIAQAVWHGTIVDEPRGQHGFGYDPHFWVEEYGRTVAELDPDIKNCISHRALAMQELLKQMKLQGLVQHIDA